MARIRSIKPEFFTSLSNAELTLAARLTFIGLWTYADDEGRGVDDVRLIKAAVWPLDRSTKAVEADLCELEKADKIVRYRAADTPLLAVTHWRRHQSINRPKASRWPGPDTAPSVIDHCASTDGAVIDHARKGKEGKGREQGREQGASVETSLPARKYPSRASQRAGGEVR